MTNQDTPPAPSPIPPAGVTPVELGPGELLDMYYLMVLSRTFEERVATLYKQGQVQGGVFSGIGQEAVTIGTCYGLEDEDFVSPSHRDLGVFLVKGVSPNAIMAQLYGRMGGMSKGRDSALHSGEPELNVFGTTSMLGSSICVSVGAALAFKMKGQPYVAVCYFGEGASCRGDFHEALNFAGVHRLPVIFVCENNHYAYSTPMNLQMAVDNVADRAASYGFAGKVREGNDVLSVWHCMREALYRARTGAGPTLIECKTYRWHGHSEHDKAMYRDDEELAVWRSRDPIPRFEVYLAQKGVLDDPAKKSVAEQAAQVVEEAEAFAKNSPWPQAEDALTDVIG